MRAFFLLGAMLVSVGSYAPDADEARPKEESVRWYLQNREAIRFVGYQGSDQKQHHFIVRIMDSWTFFQVSKRELKLPNEKGFPSATSAQMYYYLVDPSRDFQKIEPKKEANQTAREQREGCDLNRMCLLRLASSVVQKGSLHARPRVPHR